VEYHKVKEFKFIVNEIEVGYPDTYLYTSVFGGLELIIDNERVISQGFDLAATSEALYGAIKRLIEKGFDDGSYFCCTCGDFGCAYIYWEMILKKDKKEYIVNIRMEDLSGGPIGKHLYAVKLRMLINEVVFLFDKVISCMSKSKKIHPKTIDDFKKMRNDLLKLLV
jgi:hypothetical protein